MISHIDHIVFTVSDIERSSNFYQQVLNMQVISFGEQHCAVRFGEQSLYLQRLGDEVRHHAMEGAGNVGFVSDWTMEDILSHLQKHQVVVLEGPVEKQGPLGVMSCVYLNDPDNNLIEIRVPVATTQDTDY